MYIHYFRRKAPLYPMVKSTHVVGDVFACVVRCHTQNQSQRARTLYMVEARFFSCQHISSSPSQFISAYRCLNSPSHQTCPSDNSSNDGCMSHNKQLHGSYVTELIVGSCLLGARQTGTTSCPDACAAACNYSRVSVLLTAACVEALASHMCIKLRVLLVQSCCAIRSCSFSTILLEPQTKKHELTCCDTPWTFGLRHGCR